MVIDVFRDERQDAFWIVGSGLALRHATTHRPGAVYAGQWIASLCEVQLKVPQPTPSGREPNSKPVTDKCPECTQKATEANFAEITWDF
ncbi:hypothetical protein [Saccharopolyspora phatthalungensis]|uniref:Uncharacterized protein n=1 Tax=Saccharopolyspora phatthalungensis TaxID=664693 RepID=A0A840QC92_9PSEU|nr:hypothetical protein [Saccharopolyspora phatthalungensis]MBB5154503.1 hypothetical protein [Saccharopolyspora phatthalungensis]